MAPYSRSEESTATKRGEVITALASHAVKPKAPKPHQYPRRFWGEDIAAWFDSAQDGDQVQVLVHVTADSQVSLSLKDQPVLTPITTPHGVTAAADASGGFVNPYTFVPTLPRGDLTDGPGETGLGDSGAAGPPSHSHVAAGEWTGTVRVRLTTLTPLLLPDTEGPDTEPPGTEGAGRQILRTRRDQDGRPLVPGSSLKGALRSAYETITASRFGVLTDHGGRLAYRIPATQGIDVVPAVVEDDGRGGRVFRLCRGDQAWSAPGQRGNLVQPAAWVPAHGTQGRHLHLVGGLRGKLSDLHGQQVAARVCLYQYVGQRRPLRFQVWRVTHLAPDLAALKAALEATPPRDSQAPSRSLSLVAGAPAGTAGAARTTRLVTGRLSITGHSIHNKHDERFFVHTKDDVRIPVQDHHDEFWQSVLDAYTAAKDYNTVPNGLERSRHVIDAAALRGLPPGTPVYVTLGSEMAVTGVHPVMIGRLPFDRSPASLLDPSLQPATKAEQLSPADRLFGWVPTRSTQDRRRGSSGYRGRLSVRSITCTDDDWQAVLPGDGVVLAPLSGPKPTQFRFYAARDQQGSPVPPKADKKSGYVAEAGLRGRKTYRWPAVPDAYWQPRSAEQDRAVVPGTRRYREYLDPGAPATQTIRYRDWVRPGATFVADLFLDGVPTAELAALLWLLDRGQTSPLRLGAGKPHGFGVISCTLDPAGTRIWDGDAVRQGWLHLDRPDPADPARLRSLAADFESAASRHPVLAEALASYLKATAPITDHPVHYPRKTSEPEAESYKWFVANDRATRDGGVDPGWPLPHVRDPEQRLPYLPDDRADGRARQSGQGGGGGNRQGRGRRGGRPDR